ncbi:MAG: Rieske 2Fe-2S domain-containing protein [Nitrospirae bacterium]|nr:Rieske 2Fe-2S domain-containing protein [Nitrospirota bacterium]MDA1304061.1 Rieske 2Fe-2S domain-containing protein [Nitrospirota bacterium]
MNSKSLDDFIAVGKVDDIPDGTSCLVKAGGKNIALFNVSGKFFAINNICPHEGGPLVKGKLKGFVVGCPWHDLKFDVRSGFGTDGGGYCVASYDVRIKGDEVLVSSRCRDY